MPSTSRRQPAHPGRLPVAVLVASVTAAVALGAQPTQPRAQRPPTTAEAVINHGGRQRSYLVHDFAPGGRAPVVIVLHGGGGNAANAVATTNFDRVAAREGLVAVYPDGTAGRAGLSMRTWNAGHCCAGAMRNGADDVGFIAAIIDRLVADGTADPSRVYVTGMSNGGMLAHRIGRELSTKVAAIAPVVGAVFGDEPPPVAPVPAFIVVGANDANVPRGGGALRVRALPGMGAAADRDVAPALDQARYWARANGCSTPVHADSGVSSVTEWRTCTSGKPVVFHSVAGNGHAWPGGRPGREGAATPTQAFDASEAMWAFFKTQRREP